jgi:hypothetical protein
MVNLSCSDFWQWWILCVLKFMRRAPSGSWLSFLVTPPIRWVPECSMVRVLQVSGLWGGLVSQTSAEQPSPWTSPNLDSQDRMAAAYVQIIASKVTMSRCFTALLAHAVGVAVVAM